jgi:hypothetical protein
MMRAARMLRERGCIMPKNKGKGGKQTQTGGGTQATGPILNINHAGNTANANALSRLAAPSALKGRGGDKLVIYTMDYPAFRVTGLAGPNLDTIVSSIVTNDIADATNGYRQPTNHDDRDSNLPVAPGGGVVYREYFVAGNIFTWSGFPRLVGDLHNRRLYLTPTHYDTWFPDPNAAKNQPKTHKASGSGARSPFFLLRNVTLTNALFD